MGNSTTSKIAIFRASRMEWLVGQLIEQIRQRPANAQSVLVPSVVLVANAGLRNWLKLELARQRGHAGVSIVADVLPILPSTYYQQLSRVVLDAQTRSGSARFEQSALRWSIYAALDEIGDTSLDLYLSSGLSASDRALRKLELSARLAQLFGEYMIYRPQWLHEWRHVAEPQLGGLAVEPSFVPKVWRAIAQGQGKHRGELLQATAAALAAPGARLPAMHDEDTSAPLHVFGFQHMPLSELSVLSALSLHRPVNLYVPDPANVHWSGLSELQFDYRQALQADAPPQVLADLEDQLQEFVHPLTNAWGRLGQHFFMLLESRLSEPLDERDPMDENEPEPEPEPIRRLAAVQDSIRSGNADLLTSHVHQPADKSLLVHGSYTRLRELEALRNSLWSAFSEIDGLRPSDVLVVAPRMADYLPYLSAVFGQAGKSLPGQIPYQVQGVSISSTDPYLVSIERLLRLMGTRVGLSQLMQWFDSPAVQMHFGLSPEQVTEMHDTLLANGVAWGLSSAESGSPLHSLQWGLDRLVATYLMGGGGREISELPVSQHGDQRLLAAVIPWSIDTAWLGPLQQVVDTLVRWQQVALAEKSLDTWLTEFESTIAYLIGPKPEAAVDESAAVWRRRLGELKHEIATSNGELVVPFAVARQLVLDKLASVDESAPRLFGGVTFTNLATQRAVPYRFIAVLGLNDQEFPRQSSDQGLDLMRRFPQIGDRPYAVDDRYSFMETVMSARDRLHLSYIARNERDGKERNAALPLQDLMVMLGLPSDADLKINRTNPKPWLLLHPLHPTSQQYAQPSPTTLLEQWDPVPPASVETTTRTMFNWTESLEQAIARGNDMGGGVVRLDDLRAYYRRPFDSLVKQAADAVVEQPSSLIDVDVEPLDPAFNAIDTMDRRLLNAMLLSKPLTADAVPDWLALSGKLPAGYGGIDAYRQALESATSGLQVLVSHVGPLPALTQQSIDVEESIGPWRLVGQVKRVLRSQGADWLLAFKNSKVCDDELASHVFRFDRLIDLFLDWACTRLATDPARPVLMYLLAADRVLDYSQRWNEWSNSLATVDRDTQVKMLAELRQRLATLLAFRQASMDSPRFYAPRTQFEAIGVDPIKLNLAQVWLGGFNKGERQYSINSILLDADLEFATDAEQESVHQDALIQDANTILGWISV